MAAAVEMGEVDDIHSKEDSVTDGVVMNGEIAEADKAEGEMETVAPDTVEEEETASAETASADTANEDEESSQDSQKTEEKMEVDEDEELEQPPEDRQSQSEEEEVSAKNTDDDEVMDVSSNQGTLNSAEDDDDEEEEVVEKNSAEDENVVHDVDDNSDDEVQITKDSDPLSAEQNETVVLNDSNNDDDVMIVENDADKPNGTTTPEKKKEDTTTVIELDTTPAKSETQADKNAVTPRRSSRNLNKSKSYILDEDKDTPSEGSDVEEVLPQDPLAVSEVQPPTEKPVNSNKKQRNASTIVVKDTKRLVEIASKSTPQATNSGKKEPTLVIIDTNSILSGRGPVPIMQKSTITPTYPVLPVALPAQGIYPANMRATITPIPMNNTTTKTTLPTVTVNPTPAAPILPSLTDDMFVVEAPSFIVPYVYEKPPIKDLKDYVTEMKEEIKKLIEKLKKERKEKGEDGDSEDDEVEEEEKEKKKESEKKGEGEEAVEPNKRHTYFDSPIGKFFVDIGSGLVEEFVQTDLLRQQKRKRDREGGQNADTAKTISSLIKSLEYTKENNQPYKMSMKKCEYCSYKTESALAMAFHLETPHMKNFVYKCNFCPYEVRSPHDILFHMEAEHCVRGRLERAPAFHQCPNCPFEDNQKGKLSRHMVACARKFKPERNMDPPIDWEPPAKIPRAPRMKQQASLSTTAAMYQAMAKSTQMQFMKMQQSMPQTTALNRGRGRPSLGMLSKQISVKTSDGVYKQAVPGGGSVLVPTNYQVSGNQLYQVVGGQDLGNRIGGPMGLIPTMSTTSTVTIQNSTNKQSKTVHQPSISITPLPRGAGGGGGTATNNTPGIPPGAKPGDLNSKNSFVICEICDGYIKDLEQLRNHMQWIHKVKIHPKMIYNRPPLNCQKCQFRFFTDQGLERHLLGSHGLVTSSMQEAANKCKDSGRCPVCGRVYQWKLLNHVARDHNMTLKPAHLSYKCTVCTATFGMYKQFENHVYSAHSVVAKKSIEKKAASSPSKSESLLKPLKINDEITIIPQIPKSNGAGTSKEGSPSTSKGGASKIGDTSISRAERLARRKTSLVEDNN